MFPGGQKASVYGYRGRYHSQLVVSPSPVSVAHGPAGASSSVWHADWQFRYITRYRLVKNANSNIYDVTPRKAVHFVMSLLIIRRLSSLASLINRTRLN